MRGGSGKSASPEGASGPRGLLLSPGGKPEDAEALAPLVSPSTHHRPTAHLHTPPDGPGDQTAVASM